MMSLGSLNLVGLDQNANQASLQAKMHAVLELVNKEKIDVEAFKTCLSDYTILAMEMGMAFDSLPIYEKILTKLAGKLSALAFEFPARFCAEHDLVANHKCLLASISEVVKVVTSYKGLKLASDLMSAIVALRRIDTQIEIQMIAHAQIIQDIQKFRTDTGLRESVAKRVNLNDELIKLAFRLEDLSGPLAVC